MIESRWAGKDEEIMKFQSLVLVLTLCTGRKDRSKRNLIPFLENQDGVAPAGSRQYFHYSINYFNIF